MRRASALLAFGLLTATAPMLAWAGRAVPPAPDQYVVDEAGAIDARAQAALNRLLSEHDRITGEQIVFAVFKSLEGEELVDYTNRVFTAWKVGKRGKNNGVLLALFWEDHQARIEVGYGLEPVLTDARTKDVIEDQLVPLLKDGQPERALEASALEILKALESPLIDSGKADKILRGAGGGRARAKARGGNSVGGWIILLLFGAVFLILKFAEARNELIYTGGGWSQSPTRRPAGGWTFGGGSGGWGGGGGGFSGGGGSSGGGGASGSW